MWGRLIWHALALLTACLPALARAEGEPAATFAGQTVIGVREADGVASFRGIASARPPVGPLRWRPPHPPAYLVPYTPLTLPPNTHGVLQDGD